MTSLFALDGRVALVTGASSGLGSRFARVLHAAGATVVCVARRADRLDEIVAHLGSRAVSISADLLDDQQLRQAVTTTLDRLGQVDILINNAGVSANARAVDLNPVDWQRVIATDLSVPFRLSQLVGQHMIERGSGSIINVASIYGMVGAGGRMAAYAAAKGGLVNLTRELAGEWARRGVRVNALCPGFFNTELSDDVLEGQSAHDKIIGKTPMRRIGSPHELDGPVLFLASDASSYVTGTALLVDGGWTAV